MNNKDMIKNMLITPNMKGMEGSCRKNTTEVSMDIIRAITREPNPEGILAEIHTPSILNSVGQIPYGSRVLFLYKLSDPGNVGTIMRSALAFNWNHVVLVGDCVDPFNFQSLKASMGAALKVKIYSIKSEDECIKNFLIQNNIKLLFADKNLGLSLNEFQKFSITHKNESIGLCLGSESNGFKDFPLKSELTKNAIKLDMNENIDSLNVSVCAGILMHELNKYIPED